MPNHIKEMLSQVKHSLIARWINYVLYTSRKNMDENTSEKSSIVMIVNDLNQTQFVSRQVVYRVDDLASSVKKTYSYLKDCFLEILPNDHDLYSSFEFYVEKLLISNEFFESLFVIQTINQQVVLIGKGFETFKKVFDTLLEEGS